MVGNLQFVAQAGIDLGRGIGIEDGLAGLHQTGQETEGRFPVGQSGFRELIDEVMQGEGASFGDGQGGADRVATRIGPGPGAFVAEEACHLRPGLEAVLVVCPQMRPGVGKGRAMTDAGDDVVQLRA